MGSEKKGFFQGGKKSMTIGKAMAKHRKDQKRGDAGLPAGAMPNIQKEKPM